MEQTNNPIIQYIKTLKRKQIFMAIGGLIVAGALVTTLYLVKQSQDLRQRASGEEVILSYSPSQIQLAQHTETAIELKARTIAANVNVTAIQTTVKFDQDKVELVRYEDGNRSALLTPLQTPSPNNAAGTMSVTFLRPTADATVLSGDINLGRLIFKSKGTIGVTDITAINSLVTKSGSYTDITPGVEVSSLTVSSNTSVTVTTAPSGTTAPSPSPNTQPTGSQVYCGDSSHVGCTVGLYSCYVNLGNNVGKTCTDVSGSNGTYNCVKCAYVTPSPTVSPSTTPVSGVPECGVSSIPPTTGPAPLKVALHGSGRSFAPGVGVEGYEWDFDGNGTWDSPVQLDYIEHIYTVNGTYRPKFRIKGQNGKYSETCTYGYEVLVGPISTNPNYDVTIIPPANLQPSGNIDSGSRNITWTASAKAEGGYYLRVNEDGIDTTTWNAPSCDSNTNLRTGDICETINTTSYSYTFKPGKNYFVWVHSRATNGKYGEPVAATVVTRAGSEPTTSPTLTPTATIFPTATLAPNDTAINVNIALPGIGTGAENLGLNATPIHPQRTATLKLYDNTSANIKTVDAIMTYVPQSSSYFGQFPLGTTFPTGVYTAKIKVNNALYRSLVGSMQITGGVTNASTIWTGTPRNLISGDLNNDNTLGIIDWTYMIACVKNEAACTSAIRGLADLNDNGSVDEIDVQILQRGFALRDGD
jgi:hypothetical protein